MFTYVQLKQDLKLKLKPRESILNKYKLIVH